MKQNIYIFFNKNSKKVTALVFDICNNKYFECSFLLLSVPLKECRDSNLKMFSFLHQKIRFCFWQLFTIIDHQYKK